MSKPIEIYAEKKPEEKTTLSCVGKDCDYGQPSPLGRKAPYERRLEPVAPSPGKPLASPIEIKTKPLPALDLSQPIIEPSVEQAGLINPLP